MSVSINVSLHETLKCIMQHEALKLSELVPVQSLNPAGDVKKSCIKSDACRALKCVTVGL